MTTSFVVTKGALWSVATGAESSANMLGISEPMGGRQATRGLWLGDEREGG